MTIVDLKAMSCIAQSGRRFDCQIIDHYPFPPYWWVPRVTQASRRAMMEREIKQALSDPQIHLLGCLEGDVLIGFAQLHRLNWDSEHFGLEVYRLDHMAAWGAHTPTPPTLQAPVSGGVPHTLLAQGVLERARQFGANTIHTWMPMDDIVAIHALEKVGFRTMDVLVTWILDFATAPDDPQRIQPDHLDPGSQGVTVRPYKPGDEEPLTRLAALANSRQMPNRFQADPHLQTEACDELYRQWMLNSISTDLADYISVVECEGQVVGYSSLKHLGDIDGLCNLRLSQLLLGAVVPGMRRRGLATQALIDNLKWLADKTDVVYVGTQVNNIAAQRAWANLGFRPARAGPSMHLWLGDR